MRALSLLLLLVVIVRAGITHADDTPTAPPATAVEELTFRVAPERREDFLRHDRAIWTEMLAERPGFLFKETLLPDRSDNEIRLLIHWRSKAEWDAVPRELLAKTGRRFSEAMGGANRYKLTQARAFELHSRVDGKQDPESGIRIERVLTAERMKLASIVDSPGDPVYHKDKRFLAIPLKPIVQAWTERLSEKQRDGCEIVFECVDEYHSKMPLSKFLSAESWLAFSDLEAPAGEQWTTSGGGPPPKKMGGSYVVWPDVAGDDLSFTRPYAIRSLRLAPQP